MAAMTSNRLPPPLRDSPLLPPLNTTPSKASQAKSPLKAASPLTAGPNQRPIRSMLDVEPRPTPEETQSNDGSEEPIEPLTPASSDIPAFHHVVPEQRSDSTHSLSSKFDIKLSSPIVVTPAEAELVDTTPRQQPVDNNSLTMRRTTSRTNSGNDGKLLSTEPPNSSSSTPQGRSTQRPGFFTRTRSFLKRNNSSRLEKYVDQYAPHDGGNENAEGDQTPSASNASRPQSNAFTFSSRSSRTSRSATPPTPGSPASTINETESETASEDNPLERRKTSHSATNLNRYSSPRPGITWGPGFTDSGLKVPISPRRRSASTEQVPGIRRPNQRVEEEDEDMPQTQLQATFSSRAQEGVGLKARRLSLSLPGDLLVITKELEKEYKSRNIFGGKGHCVGKGATARVTVMCKRDAPKDDLYAVKEFRGKNKEENEEEWAKKIKSEYTLANSVNHPNIVRTFDLCIDKHKRYNHVMELCDQGELFNLVERGLFRNFYTLADRNCFFKQILRAVDYLHSHGIAHRDIKLENILMSKEGFLKLTDFGVSEVFCGEHPGARSSGGKCGQNMGEQRLCVPGICGSPPYIPPEVLSLKVQYDPTKFDTWSCAMVYLNLVFSGSPWQRADENNENYRVFIQGWRKWIQDHPEGLVTDEKGGTPFCGKMFKPELIGSPALKRLILKMLHPDPEKRISVHDALNGPTMRGVDCCAPESYEDVVCRIDASKGSKPIAGKLSMQKKHSHLPPREHKTPRAFQHRFDMGDGYN